MKWLLHPLLTLIAGATDSELAKYVEYLKAENKILRARLPAKIDTTEAERDRLLKVGKPQGSKIQDLITIVSPRTFQRWVQASDGEEKASTERRTRRPTRTDSGRLPALAEYTVASWLARTANRREVWARQLRRRSSSATPMAGIRNLLKSFSR